MEKARIHRMERDGPCRIQIRAGLARQRAARCCTAEDCRGAPRPMDPRVVSIRWRLQGMDGRNGSTVPRQSLRIANLEKRKERALQATRESQAFPGQGRD